MLECGESERGLKGSQMLFFFFFKSHFTARFLSCNIIQQPQFPVAILALLWQIFNLHPTASTKCCY